MISIFTSASNLSNAQESFLERGRQLNVVFHSIQYLFTLVIITSKSLNIMWLNSLNCSKPGANKSTYTFCPDITQERLWQAIKLTNYSTIFGHMQDPRVLFIFCSSDQVQRFEVQGKDKEGSTAFSAADHTTTLNHRQAKDTHANHISRLTAVDISTKTSLLKKKSCRSALPSDGCCYGVFDKTKIPL